MTAVRVTVEFIEPAVFGPNTVVSEVLQAKYQSTYPVGRQLGAVSYDATDIAAEVNQVIEEHLNPINRRMKRVDA